VAHETLQNSMILAQCGLPIFGEDFVLNPKELIGTLFLERGNGSTMQLQIRKTVNIIKEIDKVSPVDALVFLDEVGTGTDHDAGFDYGKQVLDAIAQRKVSCIFTTQFRELAYYAEEKFGAKNYQLVSDHKIVPGVGKPNLDILLNKEGFNKIINNK